MERIKILGYGEIGRSIHEVYKKAGIKDVAWKDVDKAEGPEKCDILNVCIPFNYDFTHNVIAEIAISAPRMVIIHATVAPGTTRKIAEFLPKVIVVHSPVIGVHPNLANSILTFRKWISVENEEDKSYREVFNHFSAMGIHNRGVVSPYEATELYKLWDTTYYGGCLTMNAEARDCFEKYGVSYEGWVSYLKQYNEGYKKLGMSNVVRPYFEELNMPIGKHCILPNNKILSRLGVWITNRLIDKYSK